MADCGIGDEGRARCAAAWPGLLERISAGEQIYPAIKAAGLTLGLVRAWRAEDPARQAQWDAAKSDSADVYFDEVREISINPGADAAAARVKAEQLRWLAAKRNPRVYSDKQQLDVNVRTVDLTRIIQDANARLAAARQPALVEGQVIESITHRVVEQSDDSSIIW